jgi:hypothetical protein
MRRRCFVALLTALVLSPNFVVSANAAETQFDTAVVWVADASGSVRTVDPNRYWAEAISLGANLLPAHTEVAYLAVNDAVTTRTELLDPSVPADCDSIVSAIENTVCDGYTNLSAGLAEALRTIEYSSAANKYVFLVADISESGFNLRRSKDYDQASETLTNAANLASASGVAVHLLFIGTASKNTGYLSAWNDLAAGTGGSLTFVSAPGGLPQAVEDLYFSHFSYLKTVSAGANTTGLMQEFSVEIPEIPMRRARIYISAPNLTSGIQVRVVGAEFDLKQARTYAIADLSPSFSRRVDLTLPGGASGDTRIYLIADIDIAIGASVESDAVKYDFPDGAAYRQLSTITVEATADGEPLVANAAAETIDWRLSIVAPSGRDATAENIANQDGRFAFAFYPEEFGDYRAMLTVASQGIEVAGDAFVEITEIELPEEDYSLLIAIGVGALVILAACLFALYRRRSIRRTETHILSSVSPAPGADREIVAKFSGRLDFYGIVVEGGKAEVPATVLQLVRTEGKKSVTLAWAMEQAGIPYYYADALRIHLYPGKDNALIVRNASDAAIYRSGQAYRRGQQIKIATGQKFAVVFEEGVSEYEIYYRTAAVSGAGSIGDE